MLVVRFFSGYNEFVNDSLFHLQQNIALYLINLLENKKISIKRAAEVAQQVTNIIPEEVVNAPVADTALAKIRHKLQLIPELKSLAL